MADACNMQGRWVGVYVQHGRESPISAELTQEGETLRGTMRDGATDREQSVFDLAADTAMAPGSDERITAQLRAMFPDESHAPIRYVTHLPPESTLEGWVRGTTVYFLKRYEGAQVSGFQVGEHLVGFSIPEHQVHYQGRISTDGRELDGKWWIDGLARETGPRTEGYFTLRRA